MLSNKNYPYIVKSGGLLRGRIHKHDIKNEDTNDSKDKNCQRSKKRSRKKKKTTQQLFFFYEKKKIYDLSSDDDDDDD